MRAALALAATTLVLAPGAAAAPKPLLGIDWAGMNSRLGWFDGATMTLLPGRTAPLGAHIGGWSRSPDGTKVALSQANGGINVRVVDVRWMRVLGDLDLALGGQGLRGLTWVARDRLLAFVDRPQNATLVVADPLRRAVLRRTVLDAAVSAYDRDAAALVLLLAPPASIGPARLAVVDAAGTMRSVPLEQIAIGLDYAPTGMPTAQRQAGLAVDPEAHVAYVVDADRTAVVDLASLAVTYRAPARRLAKARLPGPFLNARWLGDGAIALSEEGAGTRVLDTRSWTLRTLDAAADSFQVANGLVLVRGAAYGADGAVRFTVDLAQDQWLNADGGRYAAVCAGRMFVAAVDLATGARRTARNGRCGDLLSGRWPSW